MSLQARSISSLQAEAAAAQQDGLALGDLSSLAELGASAKYPGNIERDFGRRMKKVLGITVKPLEVSVDVSGVNILVLVLLPHELFAAIWDKNYEKASARFIGGYAVQDVWRIAKNGEEAWFLEHPLKSAILGNPDLHVPVRVWGDDAPVGKHGRAVRAVSWAPAAVRGEALQSKLLCWVIDPSVVSVISEKQLFNILAWSLDVLAAGRHPSCGPDGQPWKDGPWKDKARAALAGQALSPGGHRGLYAQSSGDGKYLQEIYHLPWHPTTDFICKFCHACKSPGPNNYANAKEDAPWTQQRRSTGEISEACMDCPLASVYGWHPETIVDDIVHDDLLGVRLTLIGSALRDLSDMHWWAPEIAGPWKVKLNHQLHHAYVSFRNFCKCNQFDHSVQPFKCNSISMSTLTSWPEYKGKAKNAATISLWLAEELQSRPLTCPLTQVLSSTLWGFAAMYVIWSESPQELSMSARRSLAIARSAGLEGYHWLSLKASENNRYAYLLRPKFHKLDECVRRAISSGRNAAWFWSFSDESWVGSISKLSGSTHRRTVAVRVPARWLATFFLELDEHHSA